MIYEIWPHIIGADGVIDLAERRNRLLRALADRWASAPPPGFTVAAGVTTAAPAVAALVGRVARMPEGMAVLPGLWLADRLSGRGMGCAGPDENGRGEATHPQFHLKLLLDRIGVGRERGSALALVGRRRVAVGPLRAPSRMLWLRRIIRTNGRRLRPAERRLSGIRLAELPDPAAEAQAIALALRRALETPGKTAALVTPDRQLAGRVSALLGGGESRPTTAPASRCRRPPGTLLLGIASAPRRIWRLYRCWPC